MSIAAYVTGAIGPGATIGLFTTNGLGIGEAAPVVADAAPDGAPGSKRRRRRSRYPRRVSIGGRLYWVENADEERRLLEAHLAKVEAEALELVREDAPKAEVARARVKVVRAVRRVEAVDDREAQWLDRLRREDEEILAMYLH